MRSFLLATMFGAVACHPSEKPVADHVSDQPAACEKDLYVPFSKLPYCLSAELQAETLRHMVGAWCVQTSATVPRAECGAYTVISRHGDPSAPLHGSESVYFDSAGHVVGRASSSNEWGPRTEGIVPNCVVGPEADACTTGK
jgi:hypothetical protein